jgi:hypothetical protein
MFDVTVHVLSSGDAFDLESRRPTAGQDDAGARPPRN